MDADIELAAARRKLNSQSAAGRTQNTDPPPDEVGIEALVLASFHDREREAKAELEALDDLASQTFASITTTILAEHGVRVDWPTTGPISAAATATRHDKMQLPSVIVAPDSPEYQKAAEMVRRASLEYVRRSRGRIAHTDFDPINGDPMFQNVTTEVAPAPVENEITFQGLVDEFMNDPKRSNLKPKSKKNHEGLFRLLVQIVGGDKPARSITREDARAVRDLLIRLPTNMTKHLPGVAPEKAAVIAERSGMPTLSPASVNDYVATLSAVLRYAVREEHIDKNVAEGLAVAVDVHPRDARQAFTDDQLRRIFGADLFRKTRKSWTHCQWVPVIALYTGARLGEVVQLRCEDIAEVDDVNVILVRAGPGQNLKNANARRLVPIHPAIKDELMAYVERRRARGEDRLFDKPPRSVGASFGCHLKKVGAKVAGGGMHQFRHLMADKLTEGHTPGDLIDELMGWARAGMRNLYGSGIRASVLAVEVAKVKHELDLSRLHVMD
ncbi:MAG: site-specific integrase [Gemmatimonadetes bacterium]|nr:site-specific integrase [Gemmatimonadota bacterium]